MTAHQHTDQCDHTEVASYAPAGRKWWARPNSPHGPECPCYVCADTRRAKGVPPLAPVLAPLAKSKRQPKTTLNDWAVALVSIGLVVGYLVFGATPW